MSGEQNIRTRAGKNAKIIGTSTEHGIDAMTESYVSGVKQQSRGELYAAVVERFLDRKPGDFRKNFEVIVEGLHGMAGSNYKRFRTKTLLYLMLVYEYGSGEGADTGKPFDFLKFFEEITDEIIDKKYRFD